MNSTRRFLRQATTSTRLRLRPRLPTGVTPLPHPQRFVSSSATFVAAARITPALSIPLRVVVDASRQEGRYSTYNNNTKGAGWWKATMVAGGAVLVGSTSTFCEEEEVDEETLQQLQQQEETDAKEFEIGPDDPYYKVPETDEPTDCSMCLTFRQGPCRLDWKRFELCVKDQDSAKKNNDKDKDENDKEENNDPTACMKYAMPFYYCSSKHVNSYLLLGNDQTQETVVEPLMDVYKAEQAQSRRLCFNLDLVLLDWTNWETFVSTLVNLGGSVPTRFTLERNGYQSPAEALKATWENNEGKQYLMMNEEGEPFLITVTAQIPIQQPLAGATGGIHETAPLMMTFALDQNGNLVGDARNNTEDEGKNNNSNSSNEPGSDESKSFQPVEKPTHLPLQLQIVPGVTQEVTIYALYVPKDGDFLEDGTLYESKPYALEIVTEKAMEQAADMAKQQQEEESKAKAEKE